MANYASFQFARKMDYKVHQLDVTATATVKTGTPTYNGLFDNPVIVTDPAAATTVTIPDGDYVGQTLMIVLESNDNSQTLTVTCTTGTDYSTSTAGQFTLMVWTGATAGWAKVAGTMT